MKCLQCGYENAADAAACNLCGSIFRKAKKPNVGNTVEMRAPLSPEEKAAQRFVLPPAPKAPAGAPAAAPSLGHRLESVGSPPMALAVGVELTIGRQPGSGFTIPSTRVSRLHAVIRWEGEQAILVGKGSSNGTFVGGKRVKEHRLQDGDEVEIGPYLCVYRFGAGPPPSNDEDQGDRTQTISGGGDLFTGSLTEGGLAEVLGGLEFNKKTGTLDVFGKEGDGWVCLESGVPLAAKANGKENEEAILSLLGMKQGRYTFTHELEAKERRCRATITALLLEWGRRADESIKGNTTHID